MANALRTAPQTCPKVPKHLGPLEGKDFHGIVPGLMSKCLKPPVLPPLPSPRASGTSNIPNTAQTPHAFLDPSLLAKQHFFLALGKHSSLGETMDRVLNRESRRPRLMCSSLNQQELLWRPQGWRQRCLHHVLEHPPCWGRCQAETWVFPMAPWC